MGFSKEYDSMMRGSIAFSSGALLILAGLLVPIPGVQAKKITTPRSFSVQVIPIDRIKRVDLSFIDVEALIEEARSEDEAGRLVPDHRRRRVTIPLPLDLDFMAAATRESIRGGGTVLRLRVDSDGARFLSFKFSKFQLPPGAEVHFVSVGRQYHDGPYTFRHNRREGDRFGTPMIPGASAVIELFLPKGTGSAEIVLETASHGFTDAMGMDSIPPRVGFESGVSTSGFSGRGGPFACQRDVNCPEGAPYQEVKRAVAEGYDGAFVCSGTLVNNVREDNRLLYLTAAHCEWWMDPAGMAYYWNYENSGCDTGDAPFEFSTGSVSLYHDVAADLNLLELDGTDVTTDFDVYFAGWNRRDIPPSRGVCLSFPADKPMQVAIDEDPILDCSPGGCSNGFGPDFWRITDYEVGMTEGGSSGGCLLDQNQLLVGLLTGGVGTNCNDFGWDEYAQIHPQWASLVPDLDPDGTGLLSLPGRDHTESSALVQGQGIDGLNVLTVLVDGVDVENQRYVVVDSSSSLEFRISKPNGLGDGKFVAHLNPGPPSAETLATLPAQLGPSCFSFLVPPCGPANPSAVWNAVGRPDKIGPSSLFGNPSTDPQKAPTTFYSVGTVDTANMPVGSKWTLQAIVRNPAGSSFRRFSVSEAVVIEVQ